MSGSPYDRGGSMSGVRKDPECRATDVGVSRSVGVGFEVRSEGSLSGTQSVTGDRCCIGTLHVNSRKEVKS